MRYLVNLNRTVMENCTVEVEATNAEEAGDLAIDDNIGDHDWENPETIEISVAECEEIKTLKETKP